VSLAFASGAMLSWLAMVLIPGPSRAPVTFVIVLAALALTGWVSARISEVHPMLPMVRTAGIGGLSMVITYLLVRCSIPEAVTDPPGFMTGRPCL
jgi:vacuolar iron transporter family protein